MNTTDLINHLTAQIGALDATYQASAAASDLYEAALWVLAVDAIKAAGATKVEVAGPMTTGGSPLPTFRTQPGSLWSGNFTFAVASFATTQRQCEVHLGVKVVGESGVAHECDVAIIEEREAQRSRTGSVHPRKSGLVAAVEAKNYVASPGIGVGRSFIGLATELGHPKSSLSFPAAGAPNLMRLLARRSSECFDEAIPGGNGSVGLEANLARLIRNWRARQP
jgi:hypothetical protein